MYRINYRSLRIATYLTSLILFAVGCSEPPQSESKPSDTAQAKETPTMDELTQDQKTHRALGYGIGDDIMLSSYSKDEVAQILEGLRLAAESSEPDYIKERRDAAMRILQKKASERAQGRQASEITDNKAAGEAYFKTLDEKEGVTKTVSGLRYEILAEGSDKFATATDSVKVHYHGTLLDGKVFDSSVDRGDPIDFRLNGVIAGFREGLTLVGEGGKIRLYMPSDIAYGDRGAGGLIGPGASLIFEVELLQINP